MFAEYCPNWCWIILEVWILIRLHSSPCSVLVKCCLHHESVSCTVPHTVIPYTQSGCLLVSSLTMELLSFPKLSLARRLKEVAWAANDATKPFWTLRELFVIWNIWNERDQSKHMNRPVEQNQNWHALRHPYQPSKHRMTKWWWSWSKAARKSVTFLRSFRHSRWGCAGSGGRV